MPGTERTLVLVKPDGVQRQLIGRILARYEARGLKVVGLKLVRVDRDLAERHYAAHREKPFFAGLVDFIISAPLVALALDGPNAIAVVRAINGATRPHEAAPDVGRQSSIHHRVAGGAARRARTDHRGGRIRRTDGRRGIGADGHDPRRVRPPDLPKRPAVSRAAGLDLDGADPLVGPLPAL